MTNAERLALTREKLTEAMGHMLWCGGPSREHAKRVGAKTYGGGGPAAWCVEVVFSKSPPKINYHPGKGLGRWEAWVPPDWIERVLEKGLACFPEQSLLVLDATPVPLLRPDGCEEAFQLTCVTHIPSQAQPLPAPGVIGVTHSYYAVTLGGVAGAAQGSTTLAMSRAVLKWEKAMGISREPKAEGSGTGAAGP